MTNVNKGHSRIDTMKDGFNRGLEYLESGSKALAFATALAVTGVHANGPTFVIDGQVYTAQQIQKNTHLLDIMDDKDYTEYMDWQMGIINNIEADTTRRQGNIDRMNANADRMNANADRMNANADRMNANADRMNAGTNKMIQITAIMEMISGERTLSNNEMYTALTAIANDANELGLTKVQSSLLQDLALSYTNGGNGPLVVSDKAKELFRSFVQKIKSQNLVLASEEKTRRLNAVIDTVLQYL